MAEKKHRIFDDISSSAWEHPADMAALQSLQRIPGFDRVLKKLFGIFAERSLHAVFMGSSVEVDAEQYPEINRVYEEILKTLDAPRRYRLYLSQDPVVNAGAVGMDEPFIVVNSGTVLTLDDDQLRFILGHEVGHILSDHVLYKTMLKLLLTVSRLALSNVFSGIAYMAVIAGLMEWDRKSELSADRAGLLAVQDVTVVHAALLRMAGGNVPGGSIEAFRNQAKRYEEHGGALDSIAKTLALLGRTHPFPVQRIKEMDRWIESGAYSECMAGVYPRKSDESAKPGGFSVWKQSAESYAESFQGSSDPLASRVRGLGASAAERAQSAVSWFKGKGDRDSD